MKNKTKLFSLILLTLISSTVIFAQATDAPANVAAAITAKLIAFEKNISGTAQDISIYVMGDAAVAAEYKKAIGKNIGKATLKKVDSGDGVPTSKPNILFVGKSANVGKALEYSRANKILSITGIVDYVNKGVTLGVGVEGGKPKILLNLSSSSDEGLDWNPAIIKIAKTIK